MNIETIIFYVFAAILILSALRVITARNPVHSALFLVLAFFTAAAIWMLLRAEFLAITLVLVYVGAVMVLFLFVVMMLDINFDRLREGFWSYLPLGATIGLLMVLDAARAGRPRVRSQQHQGAGPAAVHRIRLCVRAGRRRASGGDDRGDRPDHEKAQGHEVPEAGRPGQGQARRARAHGEDEGGKARG
jgi:NADH:ubiquinone oxidoreductase subunit 6 (subunit J)